jgi:hypothetical protein
MKQKLINFLKSVGEFFVGLGESIAYARLRQAEFYLYGKCRNLHDIEKVSEEEKRKTSNGNGIHWH